MKKAENKTECSVSAYSKAQLLKSNRFARHRDLLEALLMDSQKYSIQQAEAVIKKFNERKI